MLGYYHFTEKDLFVYLSSFLEKAITKRIIKFDTLGAGSIDMARW